MCKPNRWPNESVEKMVMDRKNERGVADHAGLRKLTESDLGLLAKSLEANRSLVAGLPRNLHWSEEIAPVLRLQDKGARGA